MVNIICFHGCGQNIDIFKSLIKPLHKNNIDHNWVFLQGKYLTDNGWGWYKYIENDMIDCNSRNIDIESIINIIKKNGNDLVLLGFSEGGQMALETSQIITKKYSDIIIKGVIAISPSYNMGLRVQIDMPVILITSVVESKNIKNSVIKWRKYIKNVVIISHNKGHKIYLPLSTRDIIKNVIFK